MNDILENHSTALIYASLLMPFLLAVPSLIAMVRGLPDRKRILVLNAAGLFFFSAWFVALAWACTGRQDISYYEAILRRTWRRPWPAKHRWRFAGRRLKRPRADLQGSLAGQADGTRHHGGSADDQELDIDPSFPLPEPGH